MIEIATLLKRLDQAYPDPECALTHKNAFELLIATILSAQCTDERVNQVTPVLFKEYPTPAAMAEAPLPALEKIIHSTGFYRAKAKSVKGTASKVTEEYGGKVPKDMDALLKFPGVARKTANVVLGTAYGIASGVVVDTHVKRLSNRLGLTKESDPKKIESDLMKILPEQRWILFSHQLIHHGRRVCQARKPLCNVCNLQELCPSSTV